VRSPDKEWQRDGTFSRTAAYGVSVSTDRGLLCIGGGEAQRHYLDVFLVKWEIGSMKTEEMPSLPRPMAYGSGVQIGTKVYVAGGLESPDAAEPLETFWGLDLGAPAGQMAWQGLPAWPGAPRSGLVAGTKELFILRIAGTTL